MAVRRASRDKVGILAERVAQRLGAAHDNGVDRALEHRIAAAVGAASAGNPRLFP